MFMRFLNLRIISDVSNQVRSFYENQVIPQLQETGHCLFASLIQNPACQEDLVSLTIWDGREYADSFGKSEAFRKIMDDIEPFLEESAEWKVQLSDDLFLEFAAVRESPVIRSYRCISQTEIDDSLNDPHPDMHVRLVSLCVKPDKTKEIQRLYWREIQPKMLSTPGCRCACLLESLGKETDYLSISIWDNQNFAENYERNGEFMANLSRLKGGLSTLYHWKMSLEKERDVHVRTSDDLRVDHYSLVTGRRMK